MHFWAKYTQQTHCFGWTVEVRIMKFSPFHHTVAPYL